MPTQPLAPPRATIPRARRFPGAFVERLFPRIPFHAVHWVNTTFLSLTLLLTLTAVPLYVCSFGLDWFQVGLFAVMFCLVGLSITLGYHRLFTHAAFQAHWSIRFLTLLFGAAAFENSVLMWACDHRAHHLHTDDDEDPYSIRDGLFQAHIGWLIFKLRPPRPWTNVPDLKKSPLVMWQHRHVYLIAAIVSFVVPAGIGFAWGGWKSALGALLIGGVARVVVLQHCTFCINSLCHAIGRQPYSKECSARDSCLTALVTFGEGYHNYHHAFPSDYRNGVKPWQFDPTKWAIWLLAKVGLASNLRRMPAERILNAEAAVAGEGVPGR